ncbi:TraR/DksA family transcriptional regulator [Streptomyces sp. NPDC002536]
MVAEKGAGAAAPQARKAGARKSAASAGKNAAPAARAKTASASAGAKKTAAAATKSAASAKKAASSTKKAASAGKSAATDEQAAAAKKTAATGKRAASSAKKAAATAKEAAPAKKAAATVAKTASAKKAAPAKNAASAKAAPAAKAPAKKSAAVKGAASAKRAASAAKAEHTGAPAEETGAGTVTGKKITDAARKVPGARAAEGVLAVRPGEEPWTPAEVAEARSELQSEVLRLRGEIAAAGEAITGLMRDSGDGAGDDQADTGTKNIAREHELALAANAREMLQQTEHALERLDAGTYGLCENCGNPIGKARMQAFPRATLCVDCKQRQERR